MICNSKVHDKSCPSYRNNALKGASSIQQQYADKKLVFNQKEVDILSKVMRMSQIILQKIRINSNNLKIF
ncbi:MAG TPA: hypothetical protein VJ697_11000 [Nitrososphaeraceae archaeon]|nr:hypothetical protein [Nitrososphaeraceae archaeon]